MHLQVTLLICQYSVDDDTQQQFSTGSARVGLGVKPWHQDMIVVRKEEHAPVLQPVQSGKNAPRDIPVLRIWERLTIKSDTQTPSLAVEAVAILSNLVKMCGV